VNNETFVIEVQDVLEQQSQPIHLIRNRGAQVQLDRPLKEAKCIQNGTLLEDCIPNLLTNDSKVQVDVVLGVGTSAQPLLTYSIDLIDHATATMVHEYASPDYPMWLKSQEITELRSKFDLEVSVEMCAREGDQEECFSLKTSINVQEETLITEAVP